MAYMRGDRCGIDNCRSTQYVLENGRLYCREGHEQPDVKQVEDDQEGFGTQGRITRQKVEKVEIGSRVYSGTQAFELFLEAHQLILWRQCDWLIKIKGFPGEIETVTRDLWALRVQSLKEKFEEEEEVLHGSQTYSSETEGQTTDTSSRKKSARAVDSHHPTLPETLALCYMSMMLLRLPISLGDLHKWARHEEIPFVRAIRLVPVDIRKRLPGQYLQALDTMSPLEPDDLQKVVIDLSLHYNKKFGVELPALNHLPLLFKYAKSCSMPLATIIAVNKLSLLLRNQFRLAIQSRHRSSDLPEMQLVSLFVIAVKLCFPFDLHVRTPHSAAEPAVLCIDWSIWQETHSTPSVAAGDSSGLYHNMKVQEQDIFDMSEKQIDDYMSWYEKMWLMPDEANTKVSEQLLELFPIHEPSDQVSGDSQSNVNYQSPEQEEREFLSKLERIQKALLLRQPTPEESGALRPGNYYKRYRKESDLTAPARAFYQKVADMVGISVETLVKVVFQTERKLQFRVQGMRRKESRSNIQGNALQESDMDVAAEKPSPDDDGAY